MKRCTRDMTLQHIFWQKYAVINTYHRANRYKQLCLWDNNKPVSHSIWRRNPIFFLHCYISLSFSGSERRTNGAREERIQRHKVRYSPSGSRNTVLHCLALWARVLVDASWLPRNYRALFKILIRLKWNHADRWGRLTVSDVTDWQCDTCPCDRLTVWHLPMWQTCRVAW
jgi:hypothetical protein